MNPTIYKALARKYRPRRFADLVGQQTNITILKNIIKRNQIHHAYLLTGTRGVGKTTIARIIAKALNCLNLTNNDPCCSCDICTQIDNGRFIDVLEIDAASNTGVDNIREIIENATFTPIAGTYKVYIIDEVHMLSKSAFNAMLKILEEPPQHIIFILATTDAHKIPITILSRCLQLKLNNLLPIEISTHLASILQQEQLPFEHEALELIAKSAAGSMRDALSLLDQVIAFSDGIISTIIVRQMLLLSDETSVYQLLDNIIHLNTTDLHLHAQKLYNDGCDLANTLESLSNILCEISIAQLTKNQINSNISEYANKISINNVHLYFEICSLGLEQIATAHNKFAIFIMTLLRMAVFNIGGVNAKEILINQNITPKIQLEPNTTKVISTKSNNNHDFFDGDWFLLIDRIKPQLGYLSPFLDNAQLNNFTEGTFDITIDERYKAGFTEAVITELNKIFTAHFKQNANFKINFTKNIVHTLKIKNQSDQDDLQAKAETSINADAKLDRILNAFSATITPYSIKPV